MTCLNRKSSRSPAPGKCTASDAHIISLIQRQINRVKVNAEIKNVYYQDRSIVVTNFTGPSFITGVFPVTPSSGGLSILQGVGQGDRVGNRITIKSIAFRGNVVPAPYNAVTNPAPKPTLVRMLLLTDRDNPTIVASPSTDFFQSGSTSAAPSGNIVDIYRPVNLDRYTVYHDQEFRMGYSNNGGTGVSVASQSYSNNDFNFCSEWNIDVAKFLRKKVYDFDDNTANSSNDVITAVFLCAPADGSIPGSVNVGLANYVLSCTYTDE